jgi:uncharacterized protein (DUF3084 family)
MNKKMVWLPRMVAVAFALLAIFTYFEHCSRFQDTKDEMKHYIYQVDKFEQKEAELISEKELLVQDLEVAEVKIKTKKMKFAGTKKKLDEVINDSTVSDTVKVVIENAISDAEQVIEIQDTTIQLLNQTIAIQEKQIENRDTLILEQKKVIEKQEQDNKRQVKNSKLRKLGNTALIASLVGLVLFFAVK